MANNPPSSQQPSDTSPSHVPERRLPSHAGVGQEPPAHMPSLTTKQEDKTLRELREKQEVTPHTVVIPDKYYSASNPKAPGPPKIKDVPYTAKIEMVGSILSRASMDSASRAKALFLVNILFSPQTQNDDLPPYFDNMI